MNQRCIVIGASAGGIDVVVELAARLPADLPAPVFVVMHVPAGRPSYLPSILSNAGPLHAIHPKDGHKVEPGFIYVAPPDHHLLIDDGHIAVKRGPKENGFRPSIDALFLSAAYSFGPAAIGVVLSGALHDGASGLWTIKRLGGTAIVQDPRDAQNASMPRSALEYVDADYRVQSNELGGLLVRLAQEPAQRVTGESRSVEQDLESRIATEVQIASGRNISPKNILELGELAPYACPECHGALVRIKEGNLSRYRCHTGHGFSDDALLDAIMQSTGNAIWQVTRGLQEAVMLLEHTGRHIREAGDASRAEKFLAKAHELQMRASRFHELAQGQESTGSDQPGQLEEDGPAG